jgi:subtilisin family serine protease
LGLAIVSTAPGSAEAGTTEDGWRTKVDAWVIDGARRSGESEFLIVFERQADLEGSAHLPSKTAKGAFVVDRLKHVADDSQGPVLHLLRSEGVVHRPFWIANMIWARAGLETIQRVATRPDVQKLAANPRVSLDTPGRVLEYRARSAASVEEGILQTGAPREFWQVGVTGEGVVIGGQDTGYDWRHPALRESYRGWDGSSVDHDYSWHDAIHAGGGRCGSDSPEPCDDGSHGTHTMGTMVGDDGTSRVGLAPSARWIGCRNMDQGVGTPVTYAECFQWFIAPTDLTGKNPDPSKAPDIINNSWTCPESEGCTSPDVLRAVVESVRAAGILVVASAGNEGPGCSSINAPIATYDAVLTVGATDSNDEIADFSSRGPVDVGGGHRGKPDMTAPGVAVRSSVPGAGYEHFSGTSMAGPHVAGVAALVLSAGECRRGLQGRLESHLLASARPRSAPRSCGEEGDDVVPNNTYGYGTLRAVLPTCPGDGRIAGAIESVEPIRVDCRNQSANSRIRARLEGVPAWNCTSRGMRAAARDRISLRIIGRTGHGKAVQGVVHGLDARKVVCRNRTTGQRVIVRPRSTNSWNCTGAGLEAAAGDRIKIILVGNAIAGSDHGSS